MADEELKIKVIVDSAEADKKLDKLEKDFKGGANGTKQMSEETKELANQVKKLTHLDIGKFGLSAIGKAKELRAEFGKIKPSIKEIRQEIAKTKATINDISKKPLVDDKSLAKAKANSVSLYQEIKKQKALYDENPTIENRDKLREIRRQYRESLKNVVDKKDEFEQSQQAEEQRKQLQAELEAQKNQLKEQRKQKRQTNRKAWDIIWNGYDEDVKDSSGNVISTLHKSGVKTAVAFLGLYETIKLIGKAIKEINKSLTESSNIVRAMNAANLSSVEGYQEMQYVMNSLGISADQYYQLLEKGDERVIDLIKHYQKLGAEYNSRQVSELNSTKQAITDMKLAWQGAWNDLADVFSGPIKTITKGLTSIGLWLSESLGKRSKDSDTILNNAKKTVEELYAMKRALAGFDELTILQQMTGTNNLLFPDIETDIEDDLRNAIPEKKDIDIGFNIGEMPDIEIKFTSNIQDILDQIAEAEGRLSKLSVTAQEPIKEEIAGLKEELKAELEIVGPQPTEPTETQRLYSEALQKLAELEKSIAKDKAKHIPVNAGTALEYRKTKEYVEELAKQLEEEAKLANAELAKAFASGLTSDEIKGQAKSAGQAIAGAIMGGINSMLPKMAQLQPYATGGVITKPTSALIGEYPGARSNPEIVSPKSMMYEMMIKANGDMASVYAQVGRQIIQAIDNKNMSVNIGDKDIAEATNRYNNNFRRVTGKSLLTV